MKGYFAFSSEYDVTKYIHKGHDAANIILENTTTEVQEINHDEIKEHVEARYVGPVEASYRILSKKLMDKSHTVIRLPVHLPNQQNLIINPGGEECDWQDILEQKNMLIDYFALNARDENARKYLYSDIPSHYTFNKKKENNKLIGWILRRSHFKTIGRMYSVNPSQTLLFHLRILLCHVKGAQKYEDLRTVNGIVYNTFTEACIERGLIKDDEEWSRALHDGEVWMMPKALRKLFACILIFCEVIYPEKLWEEFKIAMTEDFTAQKVNDPVNKALIEIEKFLNDENKSLTNFEKMPKIQDTDEDLNNHDNVELILQRGKEQYQKLNSEQKEIVDDIMKNVHLSSKERKTCFFINGPGGSGKTFIL